MLEITLTAKTIIGAVLLLASLAGCIWWEVNVRRHGR